MRGIVRVREGWCGARDGGAAIPLVVAFDKGGKGVGAKQGIVRVREGWCKREMVMRQSLRLDGEKFDKSKRWMYRK